MLACGDPAPWFEGRVGENPNYKLSTTAGRYIVLHFFGSAGLDNQRQILDDILARRDIFNDEDICFFGISTDPRDKTQNRIQDALPGIRFFLDFDGKISTLYGTIKRPEVLQESQYVYHSYTLVLDARLRVLKMFPIKDHLTHAAELIDYLEALPQFTPKAPAHLQAPILVVPHVFSPEFCTSLIDLYNTHGGIDSGFMRDRGGKTVGIIDHEFKRRSDYMIDDETITKKIQAAVSRRLVPEIKKAFQFNATRMERYLIACYDDGDGKEKGGFFKAHRDDTTKGTAHRQFAVSLNLNTGEYEGGSLVFPEFGKQTYTPPLGGAVVFSCSLLHAATPVTKGTRYAFLPFLYNDESAKIREENASVIEDYKRDEEEE